MRSKSSVLDSPAHRSEFGSGAHISVTLSCFKCSFSLLDLAVHAPGGVIVL